ncbi:hypothetical protein E2542_SST04930 [Spatholobus suberectus]|nr:hypothetical protein E2542_SST04930 [Spatholobus suberectus]
MGLWIVATGPCGQLPLQWPHKDAGDALTIRVTPITTTTTNTAPTAPSAVTATTALSTTLTFTLLTSSNLKVNHIPLLSLTSLPYLSKRIPIMSLFIIMNNPFRLILCKFFYSSVSVFLPRRSPSLLIIVISRNHKLYLTVKGEWVRKRAWEGKGSGVCLSKMEGEIRGCETERSVMRISQELEHMELDGEEEDDEPVFVLTDEWRDFFAKSEARRKLGLAEMVATYGDDHGGLCNCRIDNR